MSGQNQRRRPSKIKKRRRQDLNNCPKEPQIKSQREIALCLVILSNSLANWQNNVLKLKEIICAAIKVQQWFRRIWRQQFWRKLALFLRRVFSVRWRLRIMIRIFVKRRSVRILRYILDGSLKTVQSKKIISRYFCCVRKVQRFIRDFLVCRATKLLILRDLWNHQAMIYKNEVISQMSDAKGMEGLVCRGRKTILQTKITSSSKLALKKINKNISTWKKTDEQIKKLLNAGKRKMTPQHVAERESHNFQSLPSRVRENVLISLLRQSKRDHSMKSTRSAPSKHRRIKSIFHAADMSTLYNLPDASAGVRRGINPNIAESNRKQQPIPIFWKNFVDREGSVKNSIKKLYRETYNQIHGSPLDIDFKNVKTTRNNRLRIISSCSLSKVER